MCKIFSLSFLIFFNAFSNLTAENSTKGDIEYGKYLSSECVACHQNSGASNSIPSITGWDIETFVSVIDMYRKKERQNKVMQLVAGRLTDEQIFSLALYFSKLPENN